MSFDINDLDAGFGAPVELLGQTRLRGADGVFSSDPVEGFSDVARIEIVARVGSLRGERSASLTLKVVDGADATVAGPWTFTSDGEQRASINTPADELRVVCTPGGGLRDVVVRGVTAVVGAIDPRSGAPGATPDLAAVLAEGADADGAKITGLAEGVDPSDAATVSQLASGGSQPAVQWGYDRIVYSDTHIFHIGIDGRSPIQVSSAVTDNDANGMFKPGSRDKILYTHDRNNRADVLEIDLLTGVVTNLTTGFNPVGNGVHSGAEKAAYSPDGTKIVFAVAVAGDEYDLYVMDVDGANKTLILAGADFDGGVLSGYTPPSWSPDGTKVAFSVFSQGDDASQSGVYVCDSADGGNPTQIVSAADVGAPVAFSFYNPAWSSQDLIAFVLFNGDTGEYTVYRVNPDGAGLAAIVAAGPTSFGMLSFSPDGSKLIASDYDNVTDLWLITLDGVVSNFPGGIPGDGFRVGWGQAGDRAETSFSGFVLPHLADGSSVDQLRDLLIAGGYMELA